MNYCVPLNLKIINCTKVLQALASIITCADLSPAEWKSFSCCGIDLCTVWLWKKCVWSCCIFSSDRRLKAEYPTQKLLLVTCKL